MSFLLRGRNAREQARVLLVHGGELHLVLPRQVHDALLEHQLQLGGRLLAPGGLRALGLQLHTQLLNHRVLCTRGAPQLGAQLLEMPTRRRMRALFGLPLAARLGRLPLLLGGHLARLGCLGLRAPESLLEPPQLRLSGLRSERRASARLVRLARLIGRELLCLGQLLGHPLALLVCSGARPLRILQLPGLFGELLLQSSETSRRLRAQPAVNRRRHAASRHAGDALASAPIGCRRCESRLGPLRLCRKELDRLLLRVCVRVRALEKVLQPITLALERRHRRLGRRVVAGAFAAAAAAAAAYPEAGVRRIAP